MLHLKGNVALNVIFMWLIFKYLSPTSLELQILIARPSKKGQRCGGEGSPGWPPLDTRIDGSAAQGPPRAPSADPSIKGRALASLPQGPGEAQAAAASRAGT